MKKLLIGITLGVFLLIGSVFASDVSSKIDVFFNKINIQVNGKTVNAPNILYEGRTYVQLREVSEMLGKEVAWNDATKTASINDKTTQAQEEFTFSKVKITTDNASKLLGEVTNNTNSEKSFMGKIVFYAENGDILGTMTLVMNNLKVGETKTFQSITYDKVQGYKTYKIQIDTVM